MMTDTQKAVETLRRGKLVVLPTETVYGLAALPSVDGAVDRIYTAKGRPDGKPIAYFISDILQLSTLGVAVTEEIDKLAAAFWPGPLTLVLPAADGSFKGVRMPDHSCPLALLHALDEPLAVTSANRSGEEAARNAKEAQLQLGDAIAVYLDGGPCGSAPPSSVVKLIGSKLDMLREGSLSLEQLQNTLN